MDKAASLDHEKDEIPFRIVHKTCKLAGSSASAPPPTLVPAGLVPLGLASMASIVTKKDVIHFHGMYEILNHIQVSTSDLGNFRAGRWDCFV